VYPVALTPSTDLYGLTVVTPPVDEPLDLDDLKRHCRVELDFAEDDPLLRDMLRAAREYCETVTARQLCTATLRMTLDAFPCGDGVIELPRAPVQSVDAIAYVDSAGNTQTLDPALYLLDATREPARVTPAYGGTWPTTRCQVAAVQIDFIAGYADLKQIPAGVRHAMRLLVGGWYTQREDWITGGGGAAKIPHGVDALLWQAWPGGYS
jgi:uncharacterized phiE125 gp8 family phage protein